MPPNRADARIRTHLRPAHRPAGELGCSFDFARIDFSDVRGTIWSGEVTPSPAGGVRRYEPQECDDRLGSLWVLRDLGS
ncbi:ATP-grasp fold amidoligase family protein [Blastococcus saxobsidens]|uniref:ATP-grasp fold amidoligase family protein n=1 Tax=Blastococcus saxobsidens TaxID=138336 RepID=UPI000CEBDD38|nr:ATP-grasp fold amidoligase family protein [Blastococcus saxobsidens]